MTKLRISITATLIVGSMICTVLALTPAQKKALSKCYDQYFDDYLYCINQPHETPDSCAQLALIGFNRCKKDAGIPLSGNPPPKLPRPTPGPNKPVNPINKRPGPPPGQIKSSPSPTATAPTIFSKPSKPSPTPKKGHQ
jgi:hypothetical protein